MEQNSAAQLTPERTLKIYSSVLLVLAAIDIFNLIIGWLAGDFNTSAIMGASGASKTAALAVVLLVVGIAAVVIIMKLYMGFKGISRAKGTGSGRGHITVGKISLFFSVLLFVIYAISLFTNMKSAGFSGWLDMCTPLASCLIAYGYLKAAKKVG